MCRRPVPGTDIQGSLAPDDCEQSGLERRTCYRGLGLGNPGIRRKDNAHFFPNLCLMCVRFISSQRSKSNAFRSRAVVPLCQILLVYSVRTAHLLVSTDRVRVAWNQVTAFILTDVPRAGAARNALNWNFDKTVSFSIRCNTNIAPFCCDPCVQYPNNMKKKIFTLFLSILYVHIDAHKSP